MKKLFPIIMLSLLIILSACSGHEAPEVLTADIREMFLGAEDMKIVSDISAYYGDELFSFSVTYSGSGGGGKLTVTSPEEISGVIIDADVAGGRISFSDTVIPISEIGETGLSPVTALPMLIRQWQTGIVLLTGFEKFGDIDCFMAETMISDSEKAKTWFDADTLLPLYSELSSCGLTVVQCSFGNIMIQ